MWYGAIGATLRVRDRSAIPSSIWSAFQSSRRCSASGTSVPSAPTRAGLRASVSSMRAEQACYLALLR